MQDLRCVLRWYASLIHMQSCPASPHSHVTIITVFTHPVKIYQLDDKIHNSA